MRAVLKTVPGELVEFDSSACFFLRTARNITPVFIRRASVIDEDTGLPLCCDDESQCPIDVHQGPFHPSENFDDLRGRPTPFELCHCLPSTPPYTLEQFPQSRDISSASFA